MTRTPTDSERLRRIEVCICALGQQMAPGAGIYGSVPDARQARQRAAVLLGEIQREIAAEEQMETRAA